MILVRLWFGRTDMFGSAEPNHGRTNRFGRTPNRTKWFGRTLISFDSIESLNRQERWYDIANVTLESYSGNIIENVHVYVSPEVVFQSTIFNFS